MVILEREAYAFTSGIALGTVLFKVSQYCFSSISQMSIIYFVSLERT